MTDLIKELRECKCHCSACKENIETLSRHEQEEPLAVLCDKKGYWLGRARKFPDRWVINMDTLDYNLPDPKPIIAPTYSECEAKARQYLMGLEDK